MYIQTSTHKHTHDFSIGMLATGLLCKYSKLWSPRPSFHHLCLNSWPPEFIAWSTD